MLFIFNFIKINDYISFIEFLIIIKLNNLIRIRKKLEMLKNYDEA